MRSESVGGIVHTTHPDRTIAELVEELAIPHRAKAAYRTLFGMGFSATPALRTALSHRDGSVRFYCCMLLDHFLVPDLVDELFRMLGDPDPRVRSTVLHTLACDRC